MKKPCAGKRRYFSAKMATLEAGRLVSDGKAQPGEMHPYRCPHCSFWHVGHKVPRGLREQRKAGR